MFFADFPWVLRYLRPQKRLAAGALAVVLGATAASLLQPWPLALMVDTVLGNKPLPSLLGFLEGVDRYTLLMIAVGAGVLVTGLQSGFGVIDDYVNTKLGQSMVLHLRTDLFEHAQRLSLAYHDKKRTGHLMYQINQQASALGKVTTSIPPLFQSVLTVVGMFAITYRIDHTLALLSLTVVPCIYCSAGYYTRRIEPEVRRVRTLEGQSLAIVYEAMAMLRVIAAFGRERYEHTRFRRHAEQALDARVRLTVRQTMFSLAVTVITAMGTALVLGVGAHTVLGREMTAGELLVVMGYVSAIYKPLEQISQIVSGLQEQFMTMRGSIDLLETPHDIKERPDAKALSCAAGRITFKDVTFYYAKGRTALKHVSFDVAPGQRVAIVGPTGAGKSTLLNLIPRFYDARKGRVLLDGTDVRDVTLDSLRAQVSIVLQEPLLFSASIEDNIRYGRLDATTEEVIEAARAANVHDFIERLPEGYETKLGERGAQLSGGERQRISVARAFLKDAPILILDEPTSSIDSKTEAVILEALDRLAEGRTTFMVAHRLSTVGDAHLILVVKNGEIVEQGGHDELMAESGLYREMWDAQKPGGRPGARRRRAPGPERPIVLLGMMAKAPVPGLIWQTVHYLLGLKRLGFDPYYVEAHGRTPAMLMGSADDDGAALAASLIADVMRRFQLGDRWAYQALQDGGRCYGMSQEKLLRLYRDAELVINLHGGTHLPPEQTPGDRLVYLETDPVRLQIQLHDGVEEAHALLAQHAEFFTFAENLGRPGCDLPVPERFPFKATRQPVVLDEWAGRELSKPSLVTTVGNWRQPWRTVRYRGQSYSWTKDEQWRGFMDLPARSGGAFELALSGIEPSQAQELERQGWQVRAAMAFGTDTSAYRDYIAGSRAEFTVAKEQNIRFRTGWFSDRSATYLAAGRPVVAQDTGFGDVLPVGDGLFAVQTVEEAADAFEAIERDYARHSDAASEIAREYFQAERVLGQLVSDCGVVAPRPASPRANGRPARPRELSRRRTRDVVTRMAPEGATVLVVSKGDDELLRLERRRGWHFPQVAGGVWAGHHPGDSATAIAQLEELRARGADFIFFPFTSLWWLDHYEKLHHHLERKHTPVFRDPEQGALFDLRRPNDRVGGSA